MGIRPGEDPCRHVLGESSPNVTAIDCIETGSPGQVESPEARNPSRVGIVIREADGISAIDQILNGFLSGMRLVIDAATPEAVQIPVRAVDAGDVCANHDARV